MKTMRLLFPLLASLLLACGAVSAEAPEITPGDNLVVQGVPKISSSLADEVNRYTEFRSAILTDWHPTRREMLVRTRFANTAQIHLVKFPGGDRRQLTFFPERVPAAAFNPRQADFFVFNKDIGGSEFFQYYRYDLANGDVTLLTDGKSRNTGRVWSTGGDRMVYGSTRRNGKDVDLHVIDPSNPKSGRMLAQLEGGGWFAADWSDDDKQLLVLEEISANESYLWLMDATSGTKTLITPKGGEKVFYGGGEFTPDGKAFYTVTDKDSEFQRLALVDLATKMHTYLTSSIPWDVVEFDLSDDGKALAFVTNEAGFQKLHLMSTATHKEMPVPKLANGLVTNILWHRNNADLGFCLESARSPADVYSLNIKTGKVERWTFSETGGIVTENFSEPELIEWTSFDRKKISGFLYRPAAKFTGKRPVIIDIHGGPEGQAQPEFLGRDNYYLNELGVVIIYPNVRGSSGYGKTFLTLDNGFKREDSYKDIGALLDWIKTRPDLDGDRIMVTGGSYGGFMTLAVATNYNDKICCSLEYVGLSNLVTFLQNTSPYRQDLRRVEYGDERDPKMREFLERIAPLNNAQKITKPLFAVQGLNDPRAPASEAEQIVAAVRKNGSPVWYLLAKDEGHGFAKKKNADFLFYSTVMFIREYLLK
jgi:dipeptidyl aminopeptidase/acylaminoacyl peptidase